MRLASYVPGELIPLSLSGSICGITPCCKSRFAEGVKNSEGRRRDFRVEI